MRRIGDEDPERIINAVVAYPVEDLGGGVCLDVFARGHHDEADRQEHHHQQEALWSTPDIEDLCQWQLAEPTNDLGENARRSSQRVKRKITRDIWSQGVRDLLLHRIDEVDKENAGQEVSATSRDCDTTAMCLFRILLTGGTQ